MSRQHCLYNQFQSAYRLHRVPYTAPQKPSSWQYLSPVEVMWRTCFSSAKKSATLNLCLTECETVVVRHVFNYLLSSQIALPYSPFHNSSNVILLINSPFLLKSLLKCPYDPVGCGTPIITCVGYKYANTLKVSLPTAISGQSEGITSNSLLKIFSYKF